MPVLIVEKGRNKGQHIEWKTPKIRVGRDQRADLTIDDSVMSRHHFHIYQMDDIFYIADLGSRNGTLLNGDTIEVPAAISFGDRVQIGDNILAWHEKLPEKKTNLLVGKEIAGYSITELLGKGGMGYVYKAKQISLERDVALKILSSKLITNEVFINKFIEEARSSAKLNHPNIIQVYDVGEEDGKYFFSMEYAPNGSIQDIISGGRKLPIDEALSYFKDTLSGLEFAEKKKIVHCDIKPENLMIAEENVVKIGDLGLAQSLTDNPNKKEVLYGTPHYFAPERITVGTIDHRADIYSCGATFYRILTGVTPYKGKTSKEIIQKHINEPLRPLREVEPEIPEYLENIIMKMMAKNPEERFASNADILVELEKGKKSRPLRGHSRIRNIKKASKEAASEDVSKKIKKMTFKVLHNVLPVVVPSLIFALGYYFFAGSGKENIDNTKIVDSDNSKQNQVHSKEDIEAKNLYDAAYKKYIDDGETKSVIIAFQNVMEKYPQSRYSEKAQEVIQIISKKQIDQQEDQLQSLFKIAQEFANNNPFEYNTIIEKYEEIISLAPEHIIALEAKRQISQVQRSQSLAEQKQQRAIEFLQDEKEIDTLIREEKYQEALKQLDQIGEKFRDFPEVYAQIQNKKKQVESLLNDVVAKMEGIIFQLNAQKDFEAALKLVEELKKINTLQADLKARFWETKLQKTQLEIENKLKESIPEEQQQKIQEFLNNYEYQSCETYILKITKTTTNSNLKQKLEFFAKNMKLLQNLMERINDEIKDKTHKNHKFEISEKTKDKDFRDQLPKYPKNIYYVYLKSWDESKLAIRIPLPGGNLIGYTIDLNKLEFKWLYANLLDNQWDYKERDYLLLATFCFHYKVYDISWDYYNKYNARGEKQDSQDLYKELQTIEKQAEQIYNDDYLPALLKFRALLNKQKQDKLESKEEQELEEQRKNFEEINKDYRLNYGRTIFFLKKRKE